MGNLRDEETSEAFALQLLKTVAEHCSDNGVSMEALLDYRFAFLHTQQAIIDQGTLAKQYSNLPEPDPADVQELERLKARMHEEAGLVGEYVKLLDRSTNDGSRQVPGDRVDGAPRSGRFHPPRLDGGSQFGYPRTRGLPSHAGAEKRR